MGTELKQVTDNQEFSKTFLDWLFDRYIRSMQLQGGIGKIFSRSAMDRINNTSCHLA